MTIVDVALLLHLLSRVVIDDVPSVAVAFSPPPDIVPRSRESPSSSSSSSSSIFGKVRRRRPGNDAGSSSSSSSSSRLWYDETSGGAGGEGGGGGGDILRRDRDAARGGGGRDGSPSGGGSTSRRDIVDIVDIDVDADCPVDDEDCRAFSSMTGGTTPFASDVDGDDAYCDPTDVDCMSFLPSAHTNENTRRMTTTSPADARDDDARLACELRSRSTYIESMRIDANWRSAYCPTTRVSVDNATASSASRNAITDRIRNVNLDEYPIAVCGTSTGGVYVIDLEGGANGGTVLGVSTNAHKPGRGVPYPGGGGGGVGAAAVGGGERTGSGMGVGSSCEKRAMEHLYGTLDGGGVISVDITGNVVASSGREGGARLWRVVRDRVGGGSRVDVGGTPTSTSNDIERADGGRLVPICTLPDVRGTIVTRLSFDTAGLLWTSCYDGTVRAFDVSECVDDDCIDGTDVSAVVNDDHDDDDDVRSRHPPLVSLYRSDFAGELMNMCPPPKKVSFVSSIGKLRVSRPAPSPSRQ
jgi:hypothetical protein